MIYRRAGHRCETCHEPLDRAATPRPPATSRPPTTSGPSGSAGPGHWTSPCSLTPGSPSPAPSVRRHGQPPPSEHCGRLVRPRLLDRHATTDRRGPRRPARRPNADRCTRADKTRSLVPAHGPVVATTWNHSWNETMEQGRPEVCTLNALRCTDVPFVHSAHGEAGSRNA